MCFCGMTRQLCLLTLSNSNYFTRPEKDQINQHFDMDMGGAHIVPLLAEEQLRVDDF